MDNVTAETIARECIAARLRMINRAISKQYDRALRAHGIRVSQLNILVAVSQFGQARQQDICKALFMERSTVSRDVERMQANGWLDSATGEDARTSVLKVTLAGKKMLEKVAPSWHEVQQRAIAILGKDQIAALDRILSALRTEGAM